MSEPEAPRAATTDFIRALIAEDLRAGRHQEIVTRFPPEPNGYLHIGHAKSIALNYGIAQETGGRFNLRFDDTNPETEDVSYVESIVDTVRWLGADFGEQIFYAADYFEQMYRFAEFLIGRDAAYVDSASEEEIREARGTVTEPGFPTRFRDRTPEENLDLFRRMRAGEFPDAAHVLRAKIDLASPNMLLRDPLIYRIRHAHHYRTGDAWCIYPLYDYAHPIEDAIEGITHSLCTLEFENNRAIYDWTVDHWQDFVAAEGGVPARPRQYEFARGNLDYTVMSKRKLLELVNAGLVSGWDDPRLPTLAGLRRRGATPEAIRAFWERMGITRANTRADIGKLEFAIRDDLNFRAPRVLCVLKPLRVTITNYPEGESETLEASYWPHDVPNQGSRPVPFSRTLFIEREDFMETPTKGFHRLVPGGEVRLRYAYLIRCDEVVRDESGDVIELRCTYDPATRGGTTPDGRQVKGTIHWVSAEHGVRCEVRLYDRLFSVPDPDAGDGDFKDHLNPESLVVVPNAVIEPSLQGAEPGSRYQFERLGYFCTDSKDSRPDALVFNRTVTLRDTWAREAAPAARPAGERPIATKNGASPDANTAAPGKPREVARPPHLEERRRRYAVDLGLTAAEADVLTREQEVSDLFDATVELGAAPRSVAGWIVNVLLLEVKESGLDEIAFTPAELGRFVELVDRGTISSGAGKTVLAEMVRDGGAPDEIVARHGLLQVSDTESLSPLVDEVLTENSGKVAEYRGGKTGLLGFFVGQAMRKTGGSGNPERLKELLLARLTGE